MAFAHSNLEGLGRSFVKAIWARTQAQAQPPQAKGIFGRLVAKRLVQKPITPEPRITIDPIESGSIAPITSVVPELKYNLPKPLWDRRPIVDVAKLTLHKQQRPIVRPRFRGFAAWLKWLLAPKVAKSTPTDKMRESDYELI